MLQLSDLQSSRFQTASGFGTSTSDFLEIVNDAVSGLLVRGDWDNTTIPIQLKLDTVFNSVVFPAFVGDVRALYDCQCGWWGRDRNITMRNQWYRFVEGRGRGWEAQWCGRQRNAEYKDRVPTYVMCPTSGNVLQFAVTQAADAGATCTVFGLDTNGQPLETQNGDGTWSQGITLVGQVTPVQSSVQVSKIFRVLLTQTGSTKTLSAYNATTNTTTTLAEYGANETEPQYLCYHLTPAGPCCGNGVATILALVKLAQGSIQNPTDPVLINSREAILDAVKAIKRADASDPAGSVALWKSAVEWMNRWFESEFPEAQTTVLNDTWGNGGRCWGPRAF